MTLSQQRAFFFLLAALLLMSIVWTVLPLASHLAGSVGEPVHLSANIQTENPVTSGTDLAPILALAPFGAAQAPPDAAPQETSLNLTLLGVLIADPTSQSTAIIAAADGAPHAYGVGDTITGGATLVAVFADSATLNVAGQEETLAFTKEGDKSAGVAAIRAMIPASAGGGLESKSTDASNDTDAVIENYRKRIADNPRGVLKDVGLLATGKGYKVTASMLPDLRRAGFQPEDLVVRVNGKKVGDVDRDKELFEQIVASGRMRVEVMRNGNLVVMSFPLR